MEDASFFFYEREEEEEEEEGREEQQRFPVWRRCLARRWPGNAGTLPLLLLRLGARSVFFLLLTLGSLSLSLLFRYKVAVWAGQPKEKEKKENPCVLRWHVTQVDTPEGSPPPTLHAVCKGSQVVVKEPPEEEKKRRKKRGEKGEEEEEEEEEEDGRRCGSAEQ